jgi:hypothetical protein
VGGKGVEVEVVARAGIGVSAGGEVGTSVDPLVGVTVGVDVEWSVGTGEDCASWAWALPPQAASTIIRTGLQLHHGTFSRIVVIYYLFFRN